MASSLIFRKQTYSGRRRSYIYPTWQCRIAISSTLIRGLCRQGYNFALATPGVTPSVKVSGRCGLRGTWAPVSPLCFADHVVKQSVMHAPGYAAVSTGLTRKVNVLDLAIHDLGTARSSHLAWVGPVAASATPGCVTVTQNKARTVASWYE